jgi:hypothetical protein
MGVYWLFVGKPRTEVDIADSYSALVGALGARNLLPPVGDDSMLSSLSQLTIDPRKIRMPQGGSVGLAELGLGEVITARIMDSMVFRVELKAQHWRELPPGPLRDALRKIARAPLAIQRNSAEAISSQPSSPVFSFSESYSGARYEVTPIFEQDVCVTLMISEAR